MKIMFNSNINLPDNVSLRILDDGSSIMSYSINIKKSMKTYMNEKVSKIVLSKDKKHYIAVYRAAINTLTFSNVLGCYQMLKEWAMVDVRKATIQLKKDEINNIKIKAMETQLSLW